MLIKICGVKLVYHFHNKGVSVRQDKWVNNLIYKLVFKNSDAILQSRFLYPGIQKYIPKDRVCYCPNGIPDLDSNKLIFSQKEDKSTVEILFLSNLIETKGVFVLIDACVLFHQKQVSYQCVFIVGIGDVNEAQFAEQAQKLHLGSYITYLGKKYGIEKAYAFEKADIFAFPTYSETFGLVNLEAMQHCLSVISTFEGGLPDVVEDGVTGFLVAQKDAEALADKLEFLISNPDIRKKMGIAGRTKFINEFILPIFENKMANILNNVLEKSFYSIKN